MERSLAWPDLLLLLESGGREDLLLSIRAKALDALIPGASKMVGCEQGKRHHSEGNVAVHTSFVFESINQVAKIHLGRPASRAERFAALVHDIAKPDTQRRLDSGEIDFPGHEAQAAERLASMPGWLNFSTAERSLIEFLIREHGNAHGFLSLSERDQQRLRESVFFEQLLLFQEADARGCFMAGGGHPPFLREVLRAIGEREKPQDG